MLVGMDGLEGGREWMEGGRREKGKVEGGRRKKAVPMYQPSARTIRRRKVSRRTLVPIQR